MYNNKAFLKKLVGVCLLSGGNATVVWPTWSAKDNFLPPNKTAKNRAVRKTAKGGIAT